jgi:uncharacterized protein (DUF488 family)
MPEITLFTIGFTKKSAETFFSTLVAAGVRRIVDVRLNNVSQLAGFAKRNDLAYFLKAVAAIDYGHYPLLAPDKELLAAYQKKAIAWPEYERRFLELMHNRRAEESIGRAALDRGCLLCSEPKALHCHRRLAAEYLSQRHGNITICHL